MNTIEVTFTEGHESVTLTVDERVYADRSCGQYENGWIAFNPADETEDYFISQSGEVYPAGTGTFVGQAPALVAESERMERELDRMYAMEGM